MIWQLLQWGSLGRQSMKPKWKKLQCQNEHNVVKTPIDRRQTSISRFSKLSREFLLLDRNTAHVFYFLIVKAKRLRKSDVQQLNFSTTASLGTEETGRWIGVAAMSG